ncbi:DUF2254 domain-containing protein [Aliiruegeria lutimaris]|uniref:Predicted membrane protein n=1 Tax=Aliiruegeria lutimaris TaxID=571298 RepID=A0A1G8RXN6_9RHOB|nr:DUF2254 domain-containing protein [Aliiruegeria lutimaris]SDJ21713.1 Predicted membrane protein [Aliiruegeria lutimaris]
MTGGQSRPRQTLTGSRAWLAKLIGDLRASYWFIPGLCLIAAHLVATLTLQADRAYPELVSALPSAFSQTQVEGARGLLTLMASSVIGVAGVMFSMTMVAVSFASGNFGPRLIGNFMRDRCTQWSLGILIGTFAYCLQILRAVHAGGDAEAFLPNLSLNAALWLTLISMGVMIYFVHHVPETINVSNIASALGRRLEAGIRAEIDAGPPEPAAVTPTGAPDAQPCLRRSGYVQTLDADRLQQLAESEDWHILLRAEPGDFVTAEMPVLEVYVTARESALDEKDEAALIACFAVGDERTEDQNPSFLVDQLVEMIARAMSSGVNDPFTACDCLNRLYAALDVALIYKGGVHSVERGPMGQKQLTFPALLKRSFGASLPYVKTDRMACEHAASLVARLRPSARNEGEAEALDQLSRKLAGADPHSGQ